jgi:hypothetical protein
MRIFSIVVLASILMSSTLALAQAPGKASPALQTEFDGFIAKFRAALKANDSAAVAAMTKLPFMDDKTYSDAARFVAKAYPEFFTAQNRACVQRKKAVYDRDGNNNDVFHVLCYENIFTFTRTPSGFLFTDVGVND